MNTSRLATVAFAMDDLDHDFRDALREWAGERAIEVFNDDPYCSRSAFISNDLVVRIVGLVHMGVLDSPHALNSQVTWARMEDHGEGLYSLVRTHMALRDTFNKSSGVTVVDASQPATLDANTIDSSITSATSNPFPLASTSAPSSSNEASTSSNPPVIALAAATPADGPSERKTRKKPTCKACGTPDSLFHLVFEG